MRLLVELRRRSVLRAGSAYVVGAWLVAQVAEFLTETFAAPLWVLQSVVLALVLGLVPVLVFSWMFEFTPQGVQRQSELDRGGLLKARSGRRSDYLIALMLLVAAAGFAWRWSGDLREQGSAAASAQVAPAVPQTTEVPQAPPNSLAVLPFLDLSRSADSDVLADGLAEELLGTLGRNRGLRVTARSSAFQFKGRQLDLREVGARLGVRYVLEGSVRLAGERVRVGAQLVDARSGLQLWSETYDRTLSDLFALQDEVSGEVANALELVIDAANDTSAAGRTRSPEAHMELLRALQAGASRSVRDLDRAAAHLERALVLDPGYAAAHAELAYIRFTRALQLGEEADAPRQVGPLLERALALAPDLGEAQLLQAELLVDDPVEAERRMRLALQSAPSYARGFEILASRIARDFRRAGEAIELLDQAIALDPLSPRNHQTKAMLLMDTGDFEGAKRHYLRAIEIEPRFRMALAMLANTCMARGEFADAVVYAERAVAADPDSAMLRAGLVHHYLNVGDVEVARARLEPENRRGALEIFMFEDDIEAAMELARSPLGPVRSSGISPVVVAALRDAARNGNAAAALDLAARDLAFEGRLPAEPTAFGFNHALLVALMRLAGEAARAEALSAQMSDWIGAQLERSPPWQRGPYSLASAILLAGAGEDEAALDALEAAFSPARPYWWLLLDGNPVFERLRAHPRYVALRARLQEHLAAQRALLAQRRAAGAAVAATAERTGA